MGFFHRFLRSRQAGREVTEWQEAWTKAVANPDRHTVTDLRRRLDRLTAPDGDLEIEREMLEGLEHAVEFAATVAEQGLPAVATGHRVVGADICHFSAPVSMPDDAAQPTGRLLLTNTRAIFVGGARGITVAWHAITQPTQAHRDLILVRADGTALYRFRCNSFDDAIRGAFIARRLAGKTRTA
jgi:hypothetical protein